MVIHLLHSGKGEKDDGLPVTQTDYCLRQDAGHDIREEAFGKGIVQGAVGIRGV